MGRDDLTAQMGATVALVVLIDLAFALVVAALLEPWLAGVLATLGLASTAARYAVLGGFVLCVLLWAQLQYTRRELLAEADADPIDPATHPDLHARVTRLASLADMRVPAVAIADTDVPNSFAVGGLRTGTVVVSDGLVETLSGDELDAVIAHELVHLKNRDALVMTLASFLPALVSDEYSLLEETVPEPQRPVVWGAALLGGYLLSSAFIDAPLGSLTGLAQFGVAVALTVVVGGVLLGLFATLIVFLSRRLSRSREFVADRDGARLTGNPAALVSALATLDETITTPERDARRAYAGLEGMCLLPHGFERGDDDGFRVETRSHPPTEERIARLREVAVELERAV
ncbi:M48 family metalloprotease [Natrononativus amylolyticus]|uniref:M48 family metalloprotease n=1 Tax=Natrononativus amylolyticus TaxID=2963434 RepID=UPI0020CB9409|nr:M48 family metalloprotease [Natrononativus amylolyticus]